MEYRKKLLEYNVNNLLNNKVIYCDGTFDLLHTGHLNFFKKIRSLGCKKLIVGIISDSNVESYKRKPILNEETRGEIVKSLQCVDNVIVNCPFFNLTNNFIEYHGIDLIVYGGYPNTENPLKIWKNHYKVAIENKIINILDYSEGLSKILIINKIKNIYIYIIYV
jgi:cytidyltransferase-like protein